MCQRRRCRRAFITTSSSIRLIVALAAMAPAGMFAQSTVMQSAQSAASAPVTLRGTVYDSLHMRPLGNAMVSVDGTNLSAISDSGGAFTIEGVASGMRTVTLFHDAIENVGLSSVSSKVVVRDAMPSIAIGVPSFATLWRNACGASAAPSDSGFVFGTIRNLKGDGLENVRVTVGFMDVRKDSTASIRQRSGNGEVRTDSNGSYTVCGTPADLDLQLVADRDSSSTDLLTLPVSPERIRRQDFLLGESNGKKVAKGTVRGVVRYRDSGLPVIGARVLTNGGPETRATAKGEFVLQDVPVGTRQLEVLAVGAQPFSLTVDVDTAAMKTVNVQLQRVTTLATRDVNAVRSGRRILLDEMELRRERGLGTFIDSLEFRKYTNVRNAFRVNTSGGVRRREPCSVFIDGVDRVDNKEVGRAQIDPFSLIDVTDVAVLEYHALGTTAPIEFKPKKFRCDVVIIWTKHGIPPR